MMEIKIYKTYEINDKLWKQIVDGFNICFPNHKRTIEQLVERYKVYPLEYSYHALCYKDGEFVGFNSIIPALYQVDGNDVLMGQSCDTYVLPQFRKDIFIFMEVYNKLRERCADDGFVAFLGVPNQNSYQYSIKILKCKEVFQLDYWILPIKLGNIIGKARWLNCFTEIYAWLNIGVNALLSRIVNFKEEDRRIHIKMDETYLNERLSANKYVNIKECNYQFCYTITEDEGIRCAYIMLSNEGMKRSYRALYRCVYHILLHEKVDMIMFNGTINMKQTLLIKVPFRFQPRKLPFTVNFLKKEYKTKYDFLEDSKAWDFTLINLDVR